METIEKAKKNLAKLHRKVVTNKLGHKQTVWVRHEKDFEKKQQKKKEDFVSKIKSFVLGTEYENVMGYMRGGVEFDADEMLDIVPHLYPSLPDNKFFEVKISRNGKILNWGHVSVPNRATPKYIDIQGYQNDELWQIHKTGQGKRAHSGDDLFEEQTYNNLFPSDDNADDFVLRVETKTGKIVNWEKPSNEKLLDYFEGTGEFEGEGSKDVNFSKAINDKEIEDDVLVIRLK